MELTVTARELVERENGEQVSSLDPMRDRTPNMQGFLTGLAGEDPEAGEMLVKASTERNQLGDGQLVQLECELAECGATAHRRRAEVESAKAQLARVLSSKHEAVRRVGVKVWSAFVHAVLYVASAAIALAGEIALIRVTVGPVFGLPTRGRDAWEGWAFAVGLSLLLVVPLEIAFKRLVWDPYLEGKGAPREHSGWGPLKNTLLALCFLTAAGVLSYACVRWVHLFTEGQNAMLDDLTLIQPLFERFPAFTASALMIISLVFASSGAVSLVCGIHHAQEVWDRVVGGASELVQSFLHDRKTDRAERTVGAAEARLEDAEGKTQQAELRVLNLLDTHAKSVEAAIAEYRQGYVAGTKAREDGQMVLPDASNVRYWNRHGYEVAVPSDLPDAPPAPELRWLHEQMREDLGYQLRARMTGTSHNSNGKSEGSLS